MITFLILMGMAGAVLYSDGPIGTLLRAALGFVALLVAFALATS